MEDIKDIQIKILTQTIGTLHGEIAELRATVIVQNNQIRKVINELEVQNGSNKTSPADECDGIS